MSTRFGDFPTVGLQEKQTGKHHVTGLKRMNNVNYIRDQNLILLFYFSLYLYVPGKWGALRMMPMRTPAIVPQMGMVAVEGQHVLHKKHEKETNQSMKSETHQL